MATETEQIYNETATQTGAGTGTEAATTTPAATATPTTPYTTGNTTLDSYNTGRVDQINQLYDTQRDAALGQLEAAHNRTMSDAQAAYDKITPQYQQSRNAVGAEYERQRRNNNLQAASNGLNTGAGSQMQLAASSVYQQNQAGLEKAEKDALAEASRQQITMKEQYDADVADALAKNDAQRAAALLNEYGQQYDRMSNEAKLLASYGDFSLYATLYGQDAADGMQRSWDLQNPLLAYSLGRLTADEVFQMTGKYPPGYSAGGGGSSGGGRSYGYGGGSGGGDSSKLTYKEVAQARAEGATDTQIREAANALGLTGVETAMTRASQSGVAGGKSAGGALAAYKTTSSSSSSSSSNSTPVKKQPADNVRSGITLFGK